MRQAWMPIGIVAVFAVVGCETDANWEWPAEWQLAQPPQKAPGPNRRITEGQAPADLAQRPAAPQQSAPPDPVVSPRVEDQIQSYVGRFPADDLERKTMREPASAAAPQQNTVPSHVSAPRAEPVKSPPPVSPTRQPVEPATADVPSFTTTEMASPRAGDAKPPTATSPPTRQQPLSVELVGVGPAPTSNAPTARPQLTAQANQPVEANQALHGVQTLDELIAELDKALRDNPRQTDDLVKLCLLHLATGDDDKAMQLAERSDPLHTDLIRGLVRVIISSRTALDDPHRGAASALASADDLRRLLAQRSPVMIPKIALVTNVQSFGAYTAISPAQFPAGQPVHVFLYAEVANFRSEPTGDGRLKTELAERVEIFDKDGNVIWQREHRDIRDIVSTPRHDFFIPLEIKLPETTPAGEYTLKVTIEDKIGATTDQRRLTFVIGTP